MVSYGFTMNDVVKACMREPQGVVCTWRLRAAYFLFTRYRKIVFHSMCICRLCRTEASVNHIPQHCSVTRIGDLPNVVMAANDDLPQHVCDRCMQRVKALERAAEDLVDFHSQVSENDKILVLARGSLKRAKDAVVSPDTIKAQPPPKKLLSQRKLDFGHSKHHNI